MTQDSWRPPNWDRIAADKIGCRVEDLHLCRKDFEAGADAMFQPAYDKGRREEREALRAMGFSATSIRDLQAPHSETITIPTLKRMKQLKEIRGSWVFIPDDNKEETCV